MSTKVVIILEAFLQHKELVRRDDNLLKAT